jgi:hypothetical protein
MNTFLQDEFLHTSQEPGSELVLARNDKEFVMVAARSWHEDSVMVFVGR